MACPWDSLQQVSSAFCEKPLCAWIKEPANAWSNLSYILTGLYLWRVALTEGYLHLRWIGIVALFTGLGSFFYHMSNTYLGGCTDYLGMFMGTGLLTAYNSRRYFRISKVKMYVVFGLTTLAFFILTHIFPEDRRYLYVLGMPCCILEMLLLAQDRAKTNYSYYLKSVLLISLAAVFWGLDVTKIFCYPDNHFLNGHGMWHIFTAAAFIPLYRFYKQFAVLKG